MAEDNPDLELSHYMDTLSLEMKANAPANVEFIVIAKRNAAMAMFSNLGGHPRRLVGLLTAAVDQILSGAPGRNIRET